MVASKEKSSQHRLPDRELARVFNFSSEDLAANRLGFITREQKLNIPMAMRTISGKIFSLLPVRQRDKVEHICGMLNLKRIKIISDTDLLNYDTRRYVLSAGTHKLRFPISAEQYIALMPHKGKLHHIYYWSDNENVRIVAIEVAEYGC